MTTRFTQLQFADQDVIDIYGGVTMYINKYIVGINRSENSVLLSLWNELITELNNRGLPIPTTKSF